MERSKLLGKSFINALGAAIYTGAVAWLMFNAEKLFGQVNSFLVPLAVLLLFVVSATIVGLLVLGRPAYLYLNGSRSEGLRLLFYTIGWLFIFTILVFVFLLKF